MMRLNVRTEPMRFSSFTKKCKCYECTLTFGM